MEWIDIRIKKPEIDELIICTDGKNLGYSYYHEEEEDFLEGYISGIPDSKSHLMCGKNITHWFKISTPLSIKTRKKKINQ